MYHSVNLEESKINLFSFLLKGIIDGNEKYKNIVDPIINDAYGLAKGQKNFFNIDRENYSLIVFLGNKNKGKVEEIKNPSSLDNAEYSMIFSLLKQKNPTYTPQQ
jgi:hypothetical protein